MNMEQKTAWFILILFPISCVGFLILSSMGGWRAGFAAFGLFGLVGLAPFIFRRHFALTRISVEERDERDIQIIRRATLTGGMVSYLVFAASLMSIWAIQWQAGSETVTIDLLPLVVFCGWMSFSLTRSVMLLTLYRRGSGYAG